MFRMSTLCGTSLINPKKETSLLIFSSPQAKGRFFFTNVPHKFVHSATHYVPTLYLVATAYAASKVVPFH